MNQQQSRTPVVAAGVVAVVAAGAVLLVSRPWQDDDRASPVNHRVPHSSPSAAGPMLHHTAVEKFLVDLEDATSPTCNDAADIPASVGRTFTCVDGTRHWKIRITEVDADGGVRYELLD